MHLSLINPAIILDYQLDHGAGFDPVPSMILIARCEGSIAALGTAGTRG